MVDWKLSISHSLRSTLNWSLAAVLTLILSTTKSAIPTFLMPRAGSFSTSMNGEPKSYQSRRLQFSVRYLCREVSLQPLAFPGRCSRWVLYPDGPVRFGREGLSLLWTIFGIGMRPIAPMVRTSSSFFRLTLVNFNLRHQSWMRFHNLCEESAAATSTSENCSSPD